MVEVVVDEVVKVVVVSDEGVATVWAMGVGFEERDLVFGRGCREDLRGDSGCACVGGQCVCLGRVGLGMVVVVVVVVCVCVMVIVVVTSSLLLLS